MALALRRVPQKTWNTYLILLTEDSPPNGDALHQLAAIEEDFAAMRKVAAANVLSPEDLAHALAPLLPVRAVTLQNESLVERLRRTLPLSSAGFQTLMNGDVEQLIELLMDDV
jgi:hypothetical protein